MSIAAHVSRALLSRYSHVRMEGKRRTFDEIAAHHRAADEKRCCGRALDGTTPVTAAEKDRFVSREFS